jgi:hypothetical protein
MLSILFENVKSFGYQVRKNKYDGLEYWNKIKKYLLNEENIDLVKRINNTIGLDWNLNIKIDNFNTNNLNIIYDYVRDELKMYGEENDIEIYSLNKEILERNHFYLQLVRIPKNNKLDLIRLLQIAYNLGQFSCVKTEEEYYNSEVINFFEQNNLDELKTYIDLTSESAKEIKINNDIEILKFTNNLLIDVLDLGSK